MLQNSASTVKNPYQTKKSSLISQSNTQTLVAPLPSFQGSEVKEKTDTFNQIKNNHLATIKSDEIIALKASIHHEKDASEKCRSDLDVLYIKSN